MIGTREIAVCQTQVATKPHRSRNDANDPDPRVATGSGAAADTREGYDAYTAGNYKGAVEEFRKSAQQGDALALFYLGESYYKGRGVVQDFAEGIKWYKQSAGKGQVEAQETLGGLYFFGNGVAQDYAEAAK